MIVPAPLTTQLLQQKSQLDKKTASQKDLQQQLGTHYSIKESLEALQRDFAGYGDGTRILLTEGSADRQIFADLLKVSADLEVEGEAIGLHQNLEIAIFRIVQEALNNILKHAQASQVIVTARFLPRQTILEIRDNGKGFVVPQDASELAHSGSFGLMGLEERAQLFGGDISIQSARDEGTIVRVILPHKHATTSSG